MVFAALACHSAPDGPPTVALRPVASTPVPFSQRDDIILADSDVACITNSFEVRIRCFSRAGAVVGVFGREGEGPGEFSGPPGLMRGPDGTVGAISEDRLTIFDPTGVMVSETTLPIAYLQSSRTFGKTIHGQHFGGAAEVTPVEMDVATGEVLWERPGLDSEVNTECNSVALGVASPTGGWTFPACQRELVFFDHRDDPTPTIIIPSHYAEEFPNERDIAEMENRNSRSAFRLDVETYRRTPKRNHLRYRSLTYDDHGRLWVATERDRALSSYLDLYVGTEYVGSVRIRDRLIGYDLYRSTFVALVEREPDAAGIAWRAVDWYDIERLDFN